MSLKKPWVQFALQPYIANDNSSGKNLFTQEEQQRLAAICAPYVVNGFLNTQYGIGKEYSFFSGLVGNRGPNMLSLLLKDMSKGEVPEYLLIMSPFGIEVKSVNFTIVEKALISGLNVHFPIPAPVGLSVK